MILYNCFRGRLIVYKYSAYVYEMAGESKDELTDMERGLSKEVDTKEGKKTGIDILVEYIDYLDSETNRTGIYNEPDYDAFMKRYSTDDINDDLEDIWAVYESYDDDGNIKILNTMLNDSNVTKRSKSRRERLKRQKAIKKRLIQLRKNVTKRGGSKKKEPKKEPKVSALRTLRLHFRF